MNTSGVLLAAKTAEAARAVHQQFSGKSIQKTYLALCVGVPTQAAWTVDAHIDQHPDILVARMARTDGCGLPAVTHMEVGAGCRCCGVL
jgi:23S rRNA pseudouridine1911/1915/1917 synthase